jgi:hypothetical protein
VAGVLIALGVTVACLVWAVVLYGWTGGAVVAVGAYVLAMVVDSILDLFREPREPWR